MRTGREERVAACLILVEQADDLVGRGQQAKADTLFNQIYNTILDLQNDTSYSGEDKGFKGLLNKMPHIISMLKKPEVKKKDIQSEYNNRVNQFKSAETPLRRSERNSQREMETTIPTISAVDLQFKMTKPQFKVIIFDMRSRREFNECHIKMTDCQGSVVNMDSMVGITDWKDVIQRTIMNSLYEDRGLENIDEDYIAVFCDVDSRVNTADIQKLRKFLPPYLKSYLLGGGFTSWKNLVREVSAKWLTSPITSLAPRLPSITKHLSPKLQEMHLYTSSPTSSNPPLIAKKAFHVQTRSKTMAASPPKSDIKIPTRHSSLKEDRLKSRSSMIHSPYENSVSRPQPLKEPLLPLPFDLTINYGGSLESKEYRYAERRFPEVLDIEVVKYPDLKTLPQLDTSSYSGSKASYPPTTKHITTSGSSYPSTTSYPLPATAYPTTTYSSSYPNRSLQSSSYRPKVPPKPAAIMDKLPSYQEIEQLPLYSPPVPRKPVKQPSPTIDRSPSYTPPIPRKPANPNQVIVSNMASSFGISGLRNLGNTCFMNSILQCLSATFPFSRYFLDGSYKGHINRTNVLGSKGRVAEVYARLIRELWSEDSVVIPTDFKRTLGEIHPSFAGYEQQDSQEFLSFLLDQLHEDLNVSKGPFEPAGKDIDSETVGRDVLMRTYEKEYRHRNWSVVVDMFQGMLESVLKCLKCGKSSTTYNMFMYLSLPIPTSKTKLSIEDCLAKFLETETLEGEERWKCPRCNQLRDATKTLSIVKLPTVLLIHLKRFSFRGPFRDKLETVVSFPIHDFNLAPFIAKSNSNGRVRDTTKYELCAVSNHFGNLSGGHYTAAVKHAHSGRWFNLDDSRSGEMVEADVESKAAYILVYSTSNMCGNWWSSKPPSADW